MHKIFFLLLFFLPSISAQTIKGNIIDEESKMKVAFAKVELKSQQKSIVILSDSLGFFNFSNIETGRYDIVVEALSYKSFVIKEVLANSGKQTVLQIELANQPNLLNEVVIKPIANNVSELNINKISIEQTNRYAATWGDVARMALSFAGVSNVNDESNEIVVRGNSPKGILWMIEGVEVSNPNHFAADGASGGLVSGLSTDVLRNSTFYTGAFSANYGNALSGIFDLKLRNGNNERYENTFSIGFTGINILTEGPFKKGKRASYLLNYKFLNSTFVNKLGLGKVFNSVTPKFEDLTFKINVPFKKVNFALWALGGRNITEFTLQSFAEINNRAAFYASGLNFSYQLDNNTFFESIISLSGNENINNRKQLFTNDLEQKNSDLNYDNLRLSNNFTRKLSRNTTIQFGSIISRLAYRLSGSFYYDLGDLNLKVSDTILKSNGNTYFLQNFISIKQQYKKIQIQTGFHHSYFVLNGKNVFEPRINISKELNSKLKMSLGLGLHSKLEPISIYLFKNNLLLNGKEVNNKNLEITKSFHTVFGLNYLPNNFWSFKTEMYLQNIFDVPVGDDKIFEGIEHISLINLNNSINLNPLLSKGKGRNYGIEFTAERSLKKGYYCLVNASLFKSYYSIFNQGLKPTRFSNDFITNTLVGKEWQIGKNILNINFRNTWTGGIKDFNYQLINGIPKYDYLNGYTDKLGEFYRLDFKVNYTLNFKRTTSTFSIDINNLTNRKNPLFRFYNPIIKKFDIINQLGFLPVFNYKLFF